jgi:hypothetical protein
MYKLYIKWKLAEVLAKLIIQLKTDNTLHQQKPFNFQFIKK